MPIPSEIHIFWVSCKTVNVDSLSRFCNCSAEFEHIYDRRIIDFHVGILSVNGIKPHFQ
ncbi:MAG: hypothetical protein ACON4U_12915 [Myxococcota bacterium]